MNFILHAAALILAAGTAGAIMAAGDGRLHVFPFYFWFSLVFAALAGLPAYLAFRAKGPIPWWKAALIAFSLGLVPAVFFGFVTPDQASVNGIPTVVNGSRTLEGWKQDGLAFGSIALLSLVSGMVFWLAVHSRFDRTSETGKTRPSRLQTAAVSCFAIGVLTAAYSIPEVTRDKTCHTMMPAGKSSMRWEISTELKVAYTDWVDVGEAMRNFARERNWSYREDIRTGDFKWFQASMCEANGTRISVGFSPPTSNLRVDAYQPQGGDGWREPYASFFWQLERHWPGQMSVLDNGSRKITLPDWLQAAKPTP